MAQGKRNRLSAEQRIDMWRHWKAGKSLHEIGRAFGKGHNSIRFLLTQRGGIVPAVRRRSLRTLTLAEREDISRGIASGLSIREIASGLQRAVSTVSREVLRHGGRPLYRASEADGQAWNSVLRPKVCLLANHEELRTLVASKLILDWSPDQISKWLKASYPNNENMRVSHETIYRSLFIQARGVLKKELVQHLRSKRSIRRSRHSRAGGKSHGQIVDAISISERPAEVEDRAVPGHLQAVLWWISGDRRYADNSIRIMNTYSHQLKAYTNSNSPLQAAWSAEMWPRAAEITRYSDAGWKPEDVQVFSAMLTKINLPLIRDGSGANGNWELSMIEGMMGIAVFTDDRALLDHAEAMWHQRVPTYFYNFKLDGDHPKPLPRGTSRTTWYGQTTFDASSSGVAQETCRDLGHTGYGVAATMAAAETAHIQGDRLYESEEPRLVQAMEFHAHLLLKKDPVPQTLCGGKIHYAADYTFGIGYNEYHNRLGQPLPETREWLDKVLALPEPVDFHMMVFELLTHGEDAVGIKR